MKYVALFQYGEYEYGCINEDGKFEWRADLNDTGFLRVNLETLTQVTKNLNIPNFGYKAYGDAFLIFDKSKEEYTEYELPVLVKVFDKLTITKKRTTLKLPTEETKKKARDMYYTMEDELFRFQHKEEISKLYKAIEKGNGIAYLLHSNYPYLEQIFFHCNEFKKLFVYEYGEYIVGLKQDDNNKILTVNVPKNLVGKIIGKGGTNIKDMAENLGVKKIQVIGM